MTVWFYLNKCAVFREDWSVSKKKIIDQERYGLTKNRFIPGNRIWIDLVVFPTCSDITKCDPHYISKRPF